MRARVGFIPGGNYIARLLLRQNTPAQVQRGSVQGREAKAAQSGQNYVQLFGNLSTNCHTSRSYSPFQSQMTDLHILNQSDHHHRDDPFFPRESDRLPFSLAVLLLRPHCFRDQTARYIRDRASSSLSKLIDSSYIQDSMIAKFTTTFD
jgi:hypothetical protein